uniref:SAM domain-containing protein n=1 Tax=Angiostrongylus cantonensis TaxID=6313 RepID=A0A0K0D9M5_ANGCA
MQLDSHTVDCIPDLTRSRFGAVPCPPPFASFLHEGSACRSASCGVRDRPNDHLLLREYGVLPSQQRMSMFEALPSTTTTTTTTTTTSCSSSRTPPTFDSLNPGMRDVPAWLKSLRLHKYTAMFAELSYEQMMALNEAELEKRNVTKGARTKILQSIQKLRTRAADLRAMHEKLSLSHPERCLRCAIASLRQMITAPMIPYTPVVGESSDTIDGFAPLSCISDQNVPGLIFNLLGEVQRAVFASGRQPLDIEYEYLLMLFTIFDKLCNNEAFTPMQRQRVHQWKRLARKVIRPTDVRRRRIGFLHSGKCENCHYKGMISNENGRLTVKPDGTSLDKVLNHHSQQHKFANPIFNKNFTPSTHYWSHLVRISPSTAPMVVPQHRRQKTANSGEWNPIFSVNGGNVLRTRSRQMFGPSMSLWDSLSFPCSTVEQSGGDSTSGYCSSTSERSSGAGSPRASGIGQTLYDRDDNVSSKYDCGPCGEFCGDVKFAPVDELVKLLALVCF